MQKEEEGNQSRTASKPNVFQFQMCHSTQMQIARESSRKKKKDFYHKKKKRNSSQKGARQALLLEKFSLF